MLKIKSDGASQEIEVNGRGGDIICELCHAIIGIVATLEKRHGKKEAKTFLRAIIECLQVSYRDFNSILDEGRLRQLRKEEDELRDDLEEMLESLTNLLKRKRGK